MQQETEAAYMAFLEAGKEYCAYLEQDDAAEGRPYLLATQDILLRLYTLGRKLPAIDASGEDRDGLTTQEDNAIRGHIARGLPFSYYWQVLDPFSDSEPGIAMGDLLDDLCDIYLDLRKSIALHALNRPDASREAFWNLKFDFDTHWARHCMEAIGAIHQFLQKDVVSQGW